MSRLLLSIVSILIASATARAVVDVVPPENASPRVQYGVQRLRDAIQQNVPLSTDGRINVIKGENAPPEGFILSSPADATITVAGSDDSGVLYGCLELAERITETKQLPAKIQFSDAPVFKLRGPCIGMQKTNLLPGRRVYEYPYTTESFPFFYDKQFWTEYLDFLASNRFNTLYLWNGHPFASLVKLDDYPYALEVSDEQFQKNVEMYRWIATECDRRGIWLVQMFYNILISKPFAEKNGLETQLPAPDPKAADYTRKSIAEFVKQYPHVGLMVCLGEALQGFDNQKEWLIETILPGIKDGMKLAGLKEEPPVVIRTHATDLRLFMADALKVYKNIYTEAKFNGESLTTYEPRGSRQQVHLAMSKLGSTHLINVHILANLEPFRYGDVSFIQKCVQAGRDRLGAKGLHLYPLFFWNWPDAPDKVDPPLKQWRRDWIWFEAWGRYSWNPDIDPASDDAYWVARLTEMYGNKEAAKKILDAYNNSGECALRILRRFGITEGNRQTMSLGMTLSQLTHPEKFNAFEELWESQSPPGERIQEYVQREWEKKPHEGETPPQINEDVLNLSKGAVDDIDAIKPEQVTRNAEEFARLKNDVHCIRAMSQFYAAKTQAAMCVLRHDLSHDPGDLVEAEKHLAESVEHFRKLAELTKDTYRFANSMQTSQRKIPLPGGKGGQPAFYHWTQMLPVYEKELADFRVKSSQPAPREKWTGAAVSWKDAAATYDVKVGSQVFNDEPRKIESVSPALADAGLTGVRTPTESLYSPIEFETTEPVCVLIGYFRSDEAKFRKVPNLETDALAAEHGGQETLLADAIQIESMPPVDVHALSYGPGKHKLDPRGGEGIFLILGVVKETNPK